MVHIGIKTNIYIYIYTYLYMHIYTYIYIYFQITMAGHNTTLIAVDGADVEPVVVSLFNFHAGERADIVVCADQEPGKMQPPSPNTVRNIYIYIYTYFHIYIISFLKPIGYNIYLYLYIYI